MWRIKVVQKFFWNTANWYYCINEIVIYFYEAFLWKNWKLNKLILLDRYFIDICVKVIGKNLPQIGPNEFFAISFHIVPYSHHFMHSQVVCFEKLCSIPTSYNTFSEKSKANEKEAISIHIILASFELINTQHDQILYHWVRQKTTHTFSGARFWIFP